MAQFETPVTFFFNSSIAFHTCPAALLWLRSPRLGGRDLLLDQFQFPGGSHSRCSTLTFAGDEKKNAHLYKLDGASENLRLFKADLLHKDSLRPAIEGCAGVFHVASPLPSNHSNIENPEARIKFVILNFSQHVCRFVCFLQEAVIR